MSPAILKSLESQTRRDLAATAKSHGIAGWHGMRKQELVKTRRDAQTIYYSIASHEAAELVNLMYELYCLNSPVKILS